MVGALLLQVSELGVPVRVGGALDLFLVGLQAEALLVQQVRHRPRRDRVAGGGQLPGERVSGFDRPPQRRQGSPRSFGSTSPSNAATKPGSVIVRGFRPAPGRRTRSSSASPASSSATPLDTVTTLTPDALATVLIPHHDPAPALPRRTPACVGVRPNAGTTTRTSPSAPPQLLPQLPCRNSRAKNTTHKIIY